MAPGAEYTLAISSTFTCEPIDEILHFWFERVKLPCSVKYAAFNQLFQTLLDSSGIFAFNGCGLNAAIFRWQDLGESQRVETNSRSLIDTLVRAASGSRVPLLAISCPCASSFLKQASQSELAARLDDELAKAAASCANLHVLSAMDLLSAYPVPQIDDPIGERIGHIPYTSDFFTTLGTSLVRRFLSLVRPPAKVVVLDLDNTLWSGVVGEDGWEHVAIEAGHVEFQRQLLDLRNNGVLLAICSKNNEKDALEVFDRRSEMLLKREHFSAWQINWDPKSVNVRKIAQQLSLGSDSLVFLDDDSKECAELRANAPEVLTIQVPRSGALLSSLLRHVWPLDRLKITAEDRKRNDSYRQELSRAAIAKEATSLEQFLAALDLKVTIEPLRPDMLSRVAQLTQRTNQFNTTTVRRTEADLRGALESGQLHCFTVSVTDRFGDYGNVGAVLYLLQPAALRVDSFLLSCRALGRGVEHEILRHLGTLAIKHGLPEVVIPFIASPKNAPALKFLDSLESTAESGGLYTRSFRISAHYACEVTYRPTTFEAPIESKEKPEPLVSAAQPMVVDYQEIASRLSSVQAIRDEMHKSRGAVENLPGQRELLARGNEVEDKLAEIWSAVLELPSVGVHDDYFALGGDSLHAVKLLVRIVETFNLPDLTLSALLEAPTPAKFAAALQTQRQVRCLVPLRETGTRPPFFCIPGVGGNVLSFRALAGNLPADQPFWGLQAPGLDGSGIIDDARQIAALYLDEIRTIQAHGPYFLGGGCIGGVFAFEMAQQLVRMGEEVALLLLMDTYNPAFGASISRSRYLYCHTRFLVQRTARKLAGMSWKNWPLKLAYSGRGSEKSTARAAGKNGHGKDARIAEEKKAAGPQFRGPLQILQQVHDANLRAGDSYVPEPYPGKIVILRAEHSLEEPYQDRYLGWKSVAAGEIHVEIVPGHHAAFDKRVRAEAVDRYLRQAQQKVGALTAA